MSRFLWAQRVRKRPATITFQNSYHHPYGSSQNPIIVDEESDDDILVVVVDVDEESDNE